MATGAGECGCGQGAACVCSQPAASLKRTFSQLDGNVALPSLHAVFPNLGDGQRNQAAGVAKPAGGLSARLLNRVQSQPAASNQSGGSSGGHPAVAVAAAAAAAPHLNAGVAAPVAVTTGVGAVRQGAPGLRPSTFLDVISAPPPPGGPSAAGDVAALQSVRVSTCCLLSLVSRPWFCTASSRPSRLHLPQQVLPLFMQRILGTNFVPNSQRTDGTAPGGGRSQEPLPGSQAQSAHAPPQQQQAGPAPPRALGAMPSLDFSLKTVARFSSPHSFEWAAFQGAEAQAAGLGAFLGGEAEVHTGEQNQTALLARALTSCVFPDAQWPTDMCMAVRACLKLRMCVACFLTLYSPHPNPCSWHAWMAGGS